MEPPPKDAANPSMSIDEAPQLPQTKQIGYSTDLNETVLETGEHKQDADSEDTEWVDYDPEHDRRDINAIRSIPWTKLAEFVLDVLYAGEKPAGITARTTGRAHGTYHHVAMIVIETTIPGQEELQTKGLVLKIPFHGTSAQWLPEDGVELHNEAVLMNYIRHNCPDIPIREVLAHDDSLNNAIKAPYILMTEVESRKAYEQGWFSQPWGEMEPGMKHLHADCPSEKTEQKRMNFLRSLAHAMAQLEKLEFDKIGVRSLPRS